MSKHSDKADAAERGKYKRLYHHLRELDGPEWHASFADVERVLGFPLPQSAHDYSAWWANESDGQHSHAYAWLAAGWETHDVELTGRRLVFRRI